MIAVYSPAAITRSHMIDSPVMTRRRPHLLGGTLLDGAADRGHCHSAFNQCQHHDRRRESPCCTLTDLLAVPVGNIGLFKFKSSYDTTCSPVATRSTISRSNHTSKDASIREIETHSPGRRTGEGGVGESGKWERAHGAEHREREMAELDVFFGSLTAPHPACTSPCVKPLATAPLRTRRQLSPQTAAQRRSRCSRYFRPPYSADFGKQTQVASRPRKHGDGALFLP